MTQRVNATMNRQAPRRPAEFTTLTAGDVRWRVAADCRDQLLGPDGLRLSEWIEAGQAHIVKTGPHCTVYRVLLPALDFYLKHYRLFNTRAWLRQLIRPPKARTEFERGLAVTARGVPTVVPLGVGEHSLLPGDSFLLTRTLADAQPLGFFIESVLPLLAPERRVRVRLALAERLGELLAQMHAAGVVHHDLHVGNLLLRLDADDRPALHLIDLHAVRIGPPLDWAARRSNLILLNRWFVLRAGRSDRLRFWDSYTRAWQGVGRAGQRHLAHELEDATWQSNLDFWRNRDRRCRCNNRYYQRVCGSTAAGYAVRDLDATLLAELLQDPDAPFHRPGVRVVKDSPSSTVAEVHLAIAGKVRPAIYKRFRVTSWADPLTALLRPTAALRSWIFGHGLRERGLPTPRPLLMLQRRRGGLVREGYLLTEKLPDAVDLRTYVDDLAKLSPAERRPLLRRLIARVARLTFELHRRQLSQRDLKAANILLSSRPCPWSVVGHAFISTEAPAGKEVCLTSGRHIWLIDLVGVTLHRLLSRQRRVQNLARLHASFHVHPALTRTDRLRFLSVYLRWELTGRETWKRWWTEVGQAAREKIERNRQSGRPLY